MAEHEPSIGGERRLVYTARDLHRAGLMFDLDPASPGPGHWVPARRTLTKKDDGLACPWHGLVFMNPPFGGRNGSRAMAAKISRTRQWRRDSARLHLELVVA